jgi:hypothetical protein
MNPQQPPYQQYPPQQPGWPGNGGRHSGGYPYPHLDRWPHAALQRNPGCPCCCQRRKGKWPWVVGAVVLLLIIGSTAVPLKHGRHDD